MTLGLKEQKIQLKLHEIHRTVSVDLYGWQEVSCSFRWLLSGQLQRRRSVFSELVWAKEKAGWNKWKGSQAVEEAGVTETARSEPGLPQWEREWWTIRIWFFKTATPRAPGVAPGRRVSPPLLIHTVTLLLRGSDPGKAPSVAFKLEKSCVVFFFFNIYFHFFGCIGS